MRRLLPALARVIVRGVADDEQPGGDPQPPSGPALDPSKRPTRPQQISLARDMLGRGYAPDQVIGWLERPGIIPVDLAAEMGISPDKQWVVTRSNARLCIDRALESIDGEVAAPKNRKQARTRAMLTMMFQRAAALALDPANVGRAAQLITAAVAAADKIARIDGAYAYDGSLLLPSGIQAASAEEAVRLVAHAQATVELALRRGAMVPKGQAPPPVIDASSVEVDGEDEPDEVPAEPSGDAN